jgi:ribosome maturation factor RimP
VGGVAHFFFFGDQTSMSGIAQEPVADQARRVLDPVLARDGFELVEVEWLRLSGRWTLRVYVDKPGGVSLDDCQEASRVVEPLLDVEDFIEPAYNLEVSSPGLDRPLRKPQDFDRYAGQRAHVKSFAPVPDTAQGQPPRKHWTGVLRGFRDGAVELLVEGVVHRIPLDRIAKAHLEFDVEADLRRKD